jgi:hypothetical protein
VEMSAWTFGWEALVAAGTLLLAGGTFVLAKSTRRLAAESAQEVQAQSRPIIVPSEGSLRVFRQAPSQGHKVELVLRNVGPGPALEVKIVEGGGRMPWWTSPDIAVVASGEEYDLHLPFYDVAGAGDYTSDALTVQYQDLAGLSYSTEMWWLRDRPDGPKMSKVVVSGGYRDPRLPRPPMGDPFMVRTPPLSRRLYGAAIALWPQPGETPARLWTRTHAASRRLRVQRTQTPVQRIRWGIRRAKVERNRDVPSRVPKQLGRLFLLGRRIRSGFHTFRNIR